MPHETPARRIATALGEIDAADKRLCSDEPPERRAHFGSDRHVGMAAAKHHNRIAGRAAVGARPQSPPDAERIHDRDARAAVEQPLDESFRRIGLARARRADNRNPLIERLGRKRRGIGATRRFNDGKRGVRWPGAHRCFGPAGFEFTFHSVLSS
jgi:hypothetical protein